MAGVNLNEESARILATNSELVGTQIRSCKDEAFLHPGLLHRRILETGKINNAASHDGFSIGCICLLKFLRLFFPNKFLQVIQMCL